MTDEPQTLKRPRGRPRGSLNKDGVAKVNVHYRIDPRIDEALRNPGPVSATIEEWAKRAGDDVLSSERCGGPGVYTITNVLTGRRYVGSSGNMLKRWQTHRNDLDKGVHANMALQQAWSADRIHFRFGILFAAPSDMTREELFDLEQGFIDAEDGLYNGKPGPPIGHRPTE